jgi:hypothetical protein
MIRVIINSEPDIEKDFEIVINVGVAVGAGESCEVRAGLEWSAGDRDSDTGSLPHLDRHWQRTSNSPSVIEAKKYGHRLSTLLETRTALHGTMEWERGDLSPKRYREVGRALDIVKRAIAIARKTHDYMASVPTQLELEKYEKDS